MNDEGGQQSVTRWIRSLEAGDRSAAGKLWSRYFEDLVRLARARLRGAPRAVADEEELRMEGYSNDEVADRLGCSLRTAARKVELIRRTWLGAEVTGA
jgi:ECF sigma factor